MTDLAVTIEQRFDKTPDGKIWTSMFDYSYWTRYLEVFSQVRVLARVRDVPDVHSDLKRADGPGVTFAAVPHYLGPYQYVARMLKVRRAVRSGVRPKEAVILRLDSQLAASLERPFWKSGRPYGVEVVVDPYDAFAPGSIMHPLRPFFRLWFPWKLRRQVARAAAAAYVTEFALQERYPASAGAFTTHYSSVELPEAGFAKAPRALRKKGKRFVLIMVSLLDQMRKAPDKVMEAMVRCIAQGFDLRFVLVGDGKHRQELEQLAASLGLQDRVVFTGLLPRDRVRAELDAADLFVLPSHGEGLPRAVIEAMARGLPAIGSTISGFKELLPPSDLVPPGDVDALTQAILGMLSDPARMHATSSRNLMRARDYHEDSLRSRRIAFYRELESATTRYWKSS